LQDEVYLVGIIFFVVDVIVGVVESVFEKWNNLTDELWILPAEEGKNFCSAAMHGAGNFIP
jgi:hypothetical protein